MPSLGEAYIEVHADTGPFDRELAGSIEAALIKAEAAMRSRGRDAGNAFGQGVETAVKDHTKRIGDDLGDDLVKSAESAGKRVASTLGHVFDDFHVPDLLINDKDLDRSRSRIRTWTQDVSQSVSSAFSNISSQFSNLTGVLKQFGSVSVLANPAVLVVAAGLISGAVLGLLQVLNPLAALVAALPGALGILGVQALVLFAAFDGLSKAIKDAFKAENAKDLAKVTDKFSGGVANFLVGINAFGKLWRQVVDIAQKYFFAPFNDVLTRVAKTLGSGKIFSGISALAYQLGKFAAALVEAFGSPEFVKLIGDLLPTVAQIVSKLSGPFITLLKGFFNLIDASLPFLKRLADILGDLFTRFGDWLTKISSDGSLSDFFDKAIDTLKDLGDIAGATIDLISTLLSSLNSNGTGDTFLKSLAFTIRELDDFFKSKLGQDFIKSTVTAAQGAILFIEGFLEAIALAWQSMIYLFQGIEFVISGIASAISISFSGIGHFFGALVDIFNELVRIATGGLTNAFRNLGLTIINVGGSISQKWNDLKTSFNSSISSIITTAKTLPDKIRAAIGDLGSLLKTAGGNLIKGLIIGIENAVPGLRGTLSWITSLIPTLKGPYEKDKKLLQPAGYALMQGLRAGIAIGAADVFSDLRALTGMIGMTANANSFVFGAGSITQNFNGAQPTAGQAQALGSAVGAGIANTVNRGNMAASTRAI